MTLKYNIANVFTRLFENLRMEKAQKYSNFERYTQSSENFRIELHFSFNYTNILHSS
jgi:hypothetical protein